MEIIGDDVVMEVTQYRDVDGTLQDVRSILYSVRTPVSGCQDVEWMSQAWF